MAYRFEVPGWPGRTRAVCVALLLSVVPAEGARIRVAQESKPGAGDFHQHILGHIGAMTSPGSAAEAYAYSELHRFSFNGEQPVLRAHRSHLFFVETAEGLALFVVHDAVDDPDGGSAAVRIQILGNRQRARLLVRDDAFSPSDSYQANADGTDFRAWHSWYPCCTDGLVLGPLSGAWKIYVQFMGDPNSPEAAVEGLAAWEALSDRGRVPLALESGRRVLLEPVDTFVVGPRPGGTELTSDSARRSCVPARARCRS